MGSISINKLASRIIGQFDRNRDGVINLDKKKEVERTERFETMDRIEISTLSRERLFRAADANRDGKVTADELKAKIRAFDTDGNGELSTRGWVWNPRQEYENFEAVHGEDLVGHTSWPKPHPIPPIPVPIVPPHIGPRTELA